MILCLGTGRTGRVRPFLTSLGAPVWVHGNLSGPNAAGHHAQMDELHTRLRDAITELKGALRAAAWDDLEQAALLTREARLACDEWLASVVVPSST